MPFAVALVSPLLDEEPRVEVRAPLALVVDQIAVREERPVVLIERRHLVEGQVVHEHRDGVRGVVRTATEVDHLCSRNDILHSAALGRAVSDESSVPRTRPNRERRSCVADDLSHNVQRGASSNRAEPFPHRDRPLDHRDVLPLFSRTACVLIASACSPEPAMISSW